MATAKIQLRRDTAANWAISGVVLAAGEPGVETDTSRFKVGDGVRSWSQLPYSNGPAPAAAAPSPVGVSEVGASQRYAREDHSHPMPSSLALGSVTAVAATVTGNLTVAGTLVGGAHTHTTSSITDFSTAVPARVGEVLKAGTNITLSQNKTTGEITVTGPTIPVTSVAGKSGAVTLATTDLTNWPTTAGNTGKVLATNNGALEWVSQVTGSVVSTVAGRSGAVTLTSSDITDIPSKTGNDDKVLGLTKGSLAWVSAADPTKVVTSVNSVAGAIKLAAGANVTLTTAGDTVTIAAAAAGGGTTDVSSVNAATGDVTIKAATGSALSVATSGTTITLDATLGKVATTNAYSDLTGIPSSFTPKAHTHTGTDITGITYAQLSGVPSTFAPSSHTHSTSDVTGLTEEVQDIVGAMVAGGTGISVSYSDATGTMTVSQSPAGTYAGPATTTTPLAPYFSIQPKSMTQPSGPVSFMVRVAGRASVSFQWYKAEAGSESWTALVNNSKYEGVNSASLTLKTLEPSDNGDKFRCIAVYDFNSTIVSDTATITVTLMSFLRHPESATFSVTQGTADTSGVLSVAVYGGTPPYTYQWFESTDGGLTYSQVAYAGIVSTQPVLSSIPLALLSATSSSEERRYRCRVRDSVNAGMVSRAGIITIVGAAPSIAADPTGQAIVSGSATFQCDYRGTNVESYWERRRPGESAFAPFGGNPSIANVSGNRRSTLTLTGLTGNDVGAAYRLKAYNGVGTAYSASALLSGSAPVVTASPVSQSVVVGQNVTFSVTANAAGGTPTYQWQQRPQSGTSFTNMSGATSSTLTLSSVSLAVDGTQYRCAVSFGGATTLSDSALLSVSTPAAAGNAVFTVVPQDAVIEEGGLYSVTAVSSLLQSDDHWACVVVQYDSGAVEVHPTRTGQRHNNTAACKHLAMQYSQYEADIAVTGPCRVSVAASLSPPDSHSVSGSSWTIQPFIYPSLPCVASPLAASSRPGWVQGVVRYSEHPILKTPSTYSCSGTRTWNVPVPPHTYAQSTSARVTLRPRQQFIGPVPSTGFWNPPARTARFAGSTARPVRSTRFTGACDLSGNVVVAFGNEEPFGSYLYSADAGKTWMTRTLPGNIAAQTCIYGWNRFWVFGKVGTAFTVWWSDNGTSFTPTGWNMAFGNLNESYAVSFVNSRFFVAVQYGDYNSTYNKTSGLGAWMIPSVNSVPVFAQLPVPATPVFRTFTNVRTGVRSGNETVTTRHSALCPTVSHAFGIYYCGGNYSYTGLNGQWAGLPSPPYVNWYRGAGDGCGYAAGYMPVTLPDASQNYILSSNGYFASVSAPTTFSAITNGSFTSSINVGAQIGDFLYYGYDDAFYRRAAGNPAQEDRLYGHSYFGDGDGLGAWSDVQIMSHMFGGAYGPNLNTSIYRTTSGTGPDTGLGHAIFLNDRVIHLFRYRGDTGTSGNSTNRYLLTQEINPLLVWGGNFI